MRTLWLRADAGPEMGYGHLRRSLEVATALAPPGGVCVLAREGSDMRLAERAGCTVVRVPSDDPVTWLDAIDRAEGALLLDSYAVGERDLAAIRAAGVRLAVFDDGRRLERYDADVVIDYAPGAERLGYRGADAWCLGPSYFPLRGEFLRARHTVDLRERVSRVSITFGGSDPDDYTARVTRVVRRLDPRWEVRPVLGPGYTGALTDGGGAALGVQVSTNPEDLAGELAASDLVVSSAGGTALELAHLGVPSAVLAISPDQRPIARALGALGAVVDLGDGEHLDDVCLERSLDRLASSSHLRIHLARAARDLVDGGGARRIADVLARTWEAHA